MEAIQDKMEDLHRRLLTDPSPHVFIAYILREAGLCKMRCPVCHHRWAVLYVSDGQYGEWRLLPTKYDFHCPSCHNLGVAKGFTRFPEEKPKPSFPE